MTGQEKRDAVEERLSERNPDALLADGLDEALLGVGGRFTECLAVYSTDRAIKIFQERDGMSWEEAWDHFQFNVVGSWVGPGTPIFLEELEDL